ncbi:hypothetical protein ACH46_20590 [Gordonia phthalatica]|uniref:Uncharacterized protein n=1 Tax=Gordonia phthalatica TaxID=1136941 RepID=A0A0N9N765_9ACTN|nr:hypothetical protein ACH46_20590 [Gordonia phthalatica]
MSKPEYTVVDSDISSLILIGAALLLVGLWVSFLLVRRNRLVWAFAAVVVSTIPVAIAVAIQSGVIAALVMGVALDMTLWGGAYAYNSEGVFVRRDSQEMKDLFSWTSRRRPPGDFR